MMADRVRRARNLLYGQTYEAFESAPHARASGVSVDALARWLSWSQTAQAVMMRWSDNGEVPEWSNGHDWKSCGQRCPAGSNPALSAISLLL